jgi:hypothetical protein
MGEFNATKLIAVYVYGLTNWLETGLKLTDGFYCPIK